jgi:predicted GIY-YIG superfamily endonuclease
MYYVYALAEPTNNEIRYVGITNNLNIRLASHLCRDEGNPKSNWVYELRCKGLKPIMIVLDTAENKKEGLKKESLKIIELKEKGCELLNVTHQKIYYKFDLDGNLVDKILSVREKHRVTSRLTYAGFVWHDEPVFPYWKLEKRESAKKVKQKQIHQYTKDGIFVKTYDGVREAYRITNIDHRSISANATNRRPSAGGYVWTYTKL